jgi:hypothetical protein
MSAYVLKQQRDKNMTDAAFDEENKYRVTTTATWKTISSKELDITDIKTGNPTSVPDSEPVRWKRCD